MNQTQISVGNPPLSIGFVGGSTKSAVGYAHFVSCRMDNVWKVAAGCFSLDDEENRETAQIYGVEEARLYSTWRDMLRAEQGRLDAILVVTPTPSHYEIVTGCLEAGYPVICEKALAGSASQIREIRRIRDETKGFLVVTYNYSGYPMVRELRRCIEKGELGRNLHFQVEMPQEGFVRVDSRGNKPTPQDWRLSDGEVPTIYLDLAVHLHQLVHYLTRQTPLEVIAHQESFGWFPEVIDNVTALARYSEGLHGQYWISKSALGQRNGLRLRVYGSKAAAEWYQANPEELLFSHIDGRREIRDRASPSEVAGQPRYSRFKSGHPDGFMEAFSNLYRDIAVCLEQFNTHGKWASGDVFGAELALEGLDMIEAMVKSAETKSWQPVAIQS